MIFSNQSLNETFQYNGSSVLIHFRSNAHVEYTGFQLSFVVQELCPWCPMNSSLCFPKGMCLCEGPMEGPFCGVVENASPMIFGKPYGAVVFNWKWIYYYFDIETELVEFAFSYEKTSNQGNPQFYLLYEELPSLSVFDLQLFYYYGYDPEIDPLIVTNPALGRWYIGVYGCKAEQSDATEFVISVNITANGNSATGSSITCSPSCQNGGVCINNVCECNNTNYVGSTCSQQKSIGTGNENLFIVTVVLLCFSTTLLLSALLVLLFIVKRRFGPLPSSGVAGLDELQQLH